MAPATRFHIETFGCQMNERDSDVMAHLLSRAGMDPAGSMEDAAVVVVNTCHIRDHATQKALSLLGRLKDWRRAAAGRVLVFAGCVAEAEGKSLLGRFPHADLVLGPARLMELPALVAEALEGAPPRAVLGGPDPRGVPEAPVSPGSAFRSAIKIMEGCDRHCTYCVVPRVRGRERHRPFAEIVAEAARLAGEGVREIQLLGQAVNAYSDGAGFPGLLRALGGIAGLKRVRFISSHPSFVTAGMLEAMRDAGNVCAHLHLPVQSGSDPVLKRMGRGYTSAEYLKSAELARRTVPGLVLTTDFIVGFPGESPEDFRRTLDFIRAGGFEGAYTFKFSARPGTPAERLPDPVDEGEKEGRLAALNALVDSQSLRYNESLVGSRLEGMVEGPSADGKMWQARLASNRLVIFARGDAEQGQLRDMEVESAGTWTLAGRLAGAAVPA